MKHRNAVDGIFMRIPLTIALAGIGSLLHAHARFSPNYLVKGSNAPLQLRNSGDGLKDPLNPCGAPPTADPSKRNVFKPGQQIEVQFEETIDHPAKYLISFAKDETDQFDTILMDLDQFANDTVCPPGATSLGCVQTLSVAQDKNGPSLDDGTALDRLNNPRTFLFRLTLPNLECETCAIMLSQRMFDRSPPTNYFSCADLRLVNNPDSVTPPVQAPAKPTGLRILKGKS